MRAIHHAVALILTVTCLTGVSVAAAANAARPVNVTIATGIGVPSMIGTGMETLIKRFVPGVEVTTREFADEREVVRLVSQGKAQLGLVSIAQIEEVFRTPAARERSGLRFLMGGHAALVLHIFVPPDSPITTVSDLRGKRVAVPEAGSPGGALAKAVLQVHGLSSSESVEIRSLSSQEQLNALRAGDVDAVLVTAPLPSPVVSSPGPMRMARDDRARLLSLDDAALGRLAERFPAYSREAIEAGTYPGQHEAITTVARKNALIVRQGIDETLAYRIVQAFLEHPVEFQKVCPLGIAYTGKNALPGTTLLPLHRGAERYYREKGIVLAQATRAGIDPYDVSRLLEVRPAGGNVVAPGAEVIPQALVERIARVSGVVDVEAYLFVGVVDKGKERPFFVVGGNVGAATLRVNCHNVDVVRVIEGRALKTEDAGQKVAVVGTRYAESYALPGQRRIPVGATIDLIKPGMAAGGMPLPADATVQVVGIFSSNFPLGDSQVLLPLDVAQKLFGLEGKVSKVFVTVDRPGAKEQVAEALRSALGDDVDVVSPRRGGMRGMP